MSDGGIKQKMIQVSKKVYLKLQDKKHKLEKENECSWSFNDVIDYLLENQKNV
jgi:predicted CopG family antitoxin